MTNKGNMFVLSLGGSLVVPNGGIDTQFLSELIIKKQLSRCSDTTTETIGINQQIRTMNSIIDVVVDFLCKKYDVTPKQLRRYKTKVKQWKYPNLPYRSYDSFGGEPKTLVQPRPRGTASQ